MKSKIKNSSKMKESTIEWKLFEALTSTRVFTYAQLVKISDKNYGVLNRNITVERYSKSDLFIGSPFMIHHYAFGIPIEPHLRIGITIQNGDTFLGFQDMTLEQFEQGRKLVQDAS